MNTATLHPQLSALAERLTRAENALWHASRVLQDLRRTVPIAVGSETDRDHIAVLSAARQSVEWLSVCAPQHLRDLDEALAELAVYRESADQRENLVGELQAANDRADRAERLARAAQRTAEADAQDARTAAHVSDFLSRTAETAGALSAAQRAHLERANSMIRALIRRLDDRQAAPLRCKALRPDHEELCALENAIIRRAFEHLLNADPEPASIGVDQARGRDATDARHHPHAPQQAPVTEAA